MEFKEGKMEKTGFVYARTERETCTVSVQEIVLNWDCFFINGS